MEGRSFTLTVITPERQAYSDTVEAISVPTYLGTVGVLAHHMPLFAALTEGEVKITKGTKEHYLAIGGGFMEVAGNTVNILVSRALHADELNESEIRKAQEHAKTLLSQKVRGEEYRTAQAILRRSLLEITVLRRHKRLAPRMT